MPHSTLVLVVDDDDDVRALCGHVLALDGLEVEQAATGGEAMDKIRRGPRPDVVLLDLKMPGKSGWECLTEIKADPGLRGVPVVLFTSKGKDEDRMRGRAAGADAYVSKPFHPQNLVDTVNRVLAR